MLTYQGAAEPTIFQPQSQTKLFKSFGRVKKSIKNTKAQTKNSSLDNFLLNIRGNEKVSPTIENVCEEGMRVKEIKMHNNHWIILNISI